jgi:hypothetical protein
MFRRTAFTYPAAARHRHPQYGKPGLSTVELMVGDGPGILPSKDGSLIRKIVGSGFWRTMVRLNGVRTFIAGAMQLGYLHYSPTCDEFEDYV